MEDLLAQLIVDNRDELIIAHLYPKLFIQHVHNMKTVAAFDGAWYQSCL